MTLSAQLRARMALGGFIVCWLTSTLMFLTGYESTEPILALLFFVAFICLWNPMSDIDRTHGLGWTLKGDWSKVLFRGLSRKWRNGFNVYFILVWFLGFGLMLIDRGAIACFPIISVFLAIAYLAALAELHRVRA
ncbi:MAG: hypothetical protein ACQKBV_02335 [Puniceicoccales bacterium]